MDQQKEQKSLRSYRKEIVENLRANLQDGAMVIQRRPYTCVELDTSFDGHRFHEYYFSKVSWPDEWSEERGIQLATDKGLHAIARKIARGDVPGLGDKWAYCPPNQQTLNE